jgi:hypothetical protein
MHDKLKSSKNRIPRELSLIESDESLLKLQRYRIASFGLILENSEKLTFNETTLHWKRRPGVDSLFKKKVRPIKR